MFGVEKSQGVHEIMVTRALKVVSVFAVLAIVGMLLMACGEEEDVGNGGTGSGSSGDGGSTPTVVASPTAPASPTAEPGIEHPLEADDLIVQIRNEGGFVPPEFLLTQLPVFGLYGNGCFITQGPQIEIYPQPLLPNLLVTCLNEEGIQRILEEAQAAGLLNSDAEYEMNNIADASTTVFTVTAGGKTTTVKAYALGLDEMPGADMTEEDIAARKKLAEFQSKMTDLKSWLPASVFVSEEQPYEFERFQTVFLPADSPSAPPVDPEYEQEPVEWPLTMPLSEFGAPFFLEDARCGVVEGADLAPALEGFEEANQLTRWTSDGKEYVLYLRPLLPGEAGCVEPVR